MFEKMIRSVSNLVVEIAETSVFFLVRTVALFLGKSCTCLSFLSGKLVLCAYLFLGCLNVSGQSQSAKIITMDEAVRNALVNNPVAKNSELKVQLANSQKQSVIGFGTTRVNYGYGQIYSAVNDNYVEVVQNFGAPATFSRKRTLVNQLIKLSESEQKLAIKQLTVEVKTTYMNVIYQRNRLKMLHEESLLFAGFEEFVKLHYGTDDKDLLARTTAETQYASIQNQLFQAEQDYRIAENQLQQVEYSEDNLLPADSTLEMYSIQFSRIGTDKFFPQDYLSYYEKICNVSSSAYQLERSKFSPELYAGYFNHEIGKVKGFEGFTVGVSFPIWFLAQKAKTTEARITFNMAQNDVEYQKFSIQKTIDNLKIQLDKLFVQISYYRENALNQADLMLINEGLKLTNRELKYHEYLQSVGASFKIKLDYLESVRQYNLTAFQLEYYIN